ncbi:adenylosuccinate synthetase [Nocardia yamanashiensis]|uniref:adenylosuccinate synthetase n=1 Tax=Nocardia yamanashiensis TaxID=209247 RepID=UPI001E52CCF3|nr:adenylosuccinate synthetase [Nocardia yamanashiensis]UGT43066.1 adenylosuccinate synthetase [Nocardia yamanashiensis]
MFGDNEFGDRHLVVVDLGFGDAGKGATVDWLCSPEAGLDVAAVVRFNGGAQAAHNVVAGGRHHTFRQFGSGTFSGVPTLLSRHMLVEPIALAAEARALAALGVADPLSLLSVDERALLTTPIHGAANRCREDARGASRHGSCGIGIGETASYALEHDAPRVADCRRPDVLRRKLIALAEHYRPLLAGSGHRHDPIDDLVEVYTEFARAVAILPGDQLGRIATDGRLVFEGAQGALLDEWRGLHPYTTWSTVEPRNARAMLARIDAPGYVLGVTRAYFTRHGAGPFPTEDAALAIPERHNGTGEYQGAFRVGHLDPILLRYAIEACGGIDGLVVNHLDQVGTGAANTSPARTGCRGNRSGREVSGDRVIGHAAAHGEIRTAVGYLTADGYLDRLACGPWRDLEHQARLTGMLAGATPVLADLPDDVAAYLEAELGAPVVLTGHGPDRADRTIRTRATA